MAIGRFSINYGSSTGFGGGFDIFSAIKERFGLSDPAGISVAQARDRQNAQLWSRSVIPSMANAAASAAQAALFRQGSRLNPAQVPVSVPQTFAAQGPQRLEPLVQQGTQTMALDLGNLLGNLGSQYISARWGTPKAPQVTAPTIVAQGPNTFGLPVQTPTLRPVDTGDFFGVDPWANLFGGGGGTPPPAPGGVTINGNCPPPSYCVDGKTGKVTIKQKRRRRRRLATSSDIRDLSSLKSVLSPADLKMWIATHPS